MTVAKIPSGGAAVASIGANTSVAGGKGSTAGIDIPGQLSASARQAMSQINGADTLGLTGMPGSGSSAPNTQGLNKALEQLLQAKLEQQRAEDKKEEDIAKAKKDKKNKETQEEKDKKAKEELEEALRQSNNRAKNALDTQRAKTAGAGAGGLGGLANALKGLGGGQGGGQGGGGSEGGSSCGGSSGCKGGACGETEDQELSANKPENSAGNGSTPTDGGSPPSGDGSTPSSSEIPTNLDPGTLVSTSNQADQNVQLAEAGVEQQVKSLTSDGAGQPQQGTANANPLTGQPDKAYAMNDQPGQSQTQQWVNQDSWTNRPDMGSGGGFATGFATV